MSFFLQNNFKNDFLENFNLWSFFIKAKKYKLQHSNMGKLFLVLTPLDVFIIFQFEELLRQTPVAALTKICHPTTNIAEYLKVPRGSNTDLESLRTEFCKTNFTALQTELMTEFDIGYIMQQVKKHYTSSQKIFEIFEYIFGGGGDNYNRELFVLNRIPCFGEL